VRLVLSRLVSTFQVAYSSSVVEEALLRSGVNKQGDADVRVINSDTAEFVCT